MQLSQYFTKQEFEQSQTAIRRGLSNSMDRETEQNAVLLCKNILDPIRVYYGKPTIITSGYRSEKLNTFIGGSITSQHCQGNAADIIIPAVDLKTIFLDITTGKIELLEDYDQIIYEFGSWIHISRSNQPRGHKLQALYENNKAAYRYVNDSSIIS